MDALSEIVDLDHLGVALDRLGALQSMESPYSAYITYNLIIGWDTYLAGKDDDLLDDPGSLVLQELLNDEVAGGTGPNDGEFRVSRHELCV